MNFRGCFETTGFAWLRVARRPIRDLGSTLPTAVRQLPRDLLESVWLSTPPLIEAILSSGSDDLAPKHRRTLTRYHLRMAGRPTPFGLFATGSLVEVSKVEGTLPACFELEHNDPIVRYSVLDFAIARRLAALWRQALGSECRYETTGALWRQGARLHYLRGEFSSDSTASFLATIVRGTKPLFDALHFARERGGVSLSALEAHLSNRLPLAPRDEIVGFLRELIAEGLLLPRLDPQIIGGDVLSELRSEAVISGAHPRDLRRFDRLEGRLRNLDGAGDSLSASQSLRRGLIRAKLAGDAPTALHVAAFRPLRSGALDVGLAEEIGSGLELLGALAPHSGPPALESFRRAVERRYGDTALPLLELLDNRIGLGREWRRTLESTPSDAGSESAECLKLAFASAPKGGAEWTLDEKHVAALLEAGRTRAKAIRSLAALVTLGSDSAGRACVVLHGGYGPSAAAFLGRFCAGHPDLRRRVRELMDLEQALEPSVRLAEIAHLAAPRAGNVLHRPVLRDAQIPLLAPAAEQGIESLALGDLLVRSDGTRLLLMSRRDSRHIEPSSLNAHNFRFPGNLPLYHFLSLLPLQGIPQPLRWNWGALGGSPFLPRVRWGRLVLSRASWTLSGPPPQPEAFESWKNEHRLPQFIGLRTGEDELSLDLAAPDCRDVFLDEFRRRREVSVVEVLPLPDQLAVRRGSDSYCHELIVPFVRRGGTTAGPTPPPRRRAPVAAIRKHSDRWLYLRIFAPDEELDSTLVQCVGPTVSHLRRIGQIEDWFFLRYADPAFHLRLRILPVASGEPESLFAVISQYFGPALRSRRLHRVEWDLYQAEEHHYGSHPTLREVERLFGLDSDSALQIVRFLGRENTEQARLQWMVFNLHHWFEALRWPIEKRLPLVRSLREVSLAASSSAPPDRSALAALFRDQRKTLEAVLGEPSQGVPVKIARAARRRTARVSPLLEALSRSPRFRRPSAFSDLVGRILHLATNRLQSWPDRAEEAMVLDLLERIYLSRVARG